MKKTFLFLLLSGIMSLAGAQNLLNYEWKFQTGDNQTWAEAGFDDSSWGTIKAGLDWENQGFDSYDGYAWYRQKVLIPSTFKEEAEENGGFALRLGRIDDCDVAYWNGEKIGSTGKLPPEYSTGYGELRSYTIPTSKILWDRENAIAVRVYDGGGGGGIIQEPIGLSVIGAEELISMDVSMERPDHLFLDQRKVAFGLVLGNDLKQTLKGVMKIEGKSDFGQLVYTDELNVKVKSGGKKEMNLIAGDLAPGFYNFIATLESELTTKQLKFSLGVRPEEIVSPLDRPDDFEDYWMRARRELDAVAPQYKLTRQEEYCTGTREVFLLEMRSLGNILVRGWYSKPVKAGTYPALLQVQGYSSTMVPGYVANADEGIVSLALNIRGHGNSRDVVNPGFPGYILHHVDDKELYIYRGAYMDCTRAVDFLYSRDEVDTSMVAVQGGSQGGALSFATAALNPDRIDLCMPSVPFLSDFRDYFKLVAWPGGEFTNYFAEHPEISEDEIYKNLSYIDIKNLAPWIEAPVQMAIGLLDVTCPPHINFAAYNQLKTKKSYVVYPWSGHGMPSEYYKVTQDYLKKHFGLDK